MVVVRLRYFTSVMRNPLAEAENAVPQTPDVGVLIVSPLMVAAAEIEITPVVQEGEVGEMSIMVWSWPAPTRVIALLTKSELPFTPQVTVPAGMLTVLPAGAASMAA